MSNYAPYARVILRYLVGGAVVGSVAAGDKLAADPDLVLALAAAISFAVELAYMRARRTGGPT